MTFWQGYFALMNPGFLGFLAAIFTLMLGVFGATIAVVEILDRRARR